MSVKEQIIKIQSKLPINVKLVAVSKTHPAEAIAEAFDAGQRAFGESRPQEMAAKQKKLPEGIEWHMIGHLQRNKVRMIMPFVSMIHSVDSGRLLDVIDSEALRINRTVDVLLEVHIGSEQSKDGWRPEELYDYLDRGEWRDFGNVRIRGVMGIASNTSDQMQVRAEFLSLKAIFEALRRRYFGREFDTLSMGMTSDYQIAVECGSNMVRIGSLIFGER